MAWRADVLHACVDDNRHGTQTAIRSALTPREVRFVAAVDLPSLLPEIEVLICGSPPKIDWTNATKLRLVHFLGAGVDGFFPPNGLAPDVVIANARGIHTYEMRDHTLAMILALERDLPATITRQKARAWERHPLGTVHDKTLVVLGVGEVGAPIIKACAQLGMHVIGVCARPRAIEGTSKVVGPDALDEVLTVADYLVVALTLSNKTRGMLDRARLALLPQHAALVVISRGGIVDEHALAEMLRDGRLRAAALDVFEHEPLPRDSPLWSLPNVIVTPHIAGWMPGYVERAVRVVADNLERLEAGLPVSTPVDREREY